MFCAISGSAPAEPVVDKNSGRLYERSLIEKYIKEHGKSPFGEESLTLEDLVPIKAEQARPRTVPEASIPGLINTIHNEWDAVMLETHQLRQSLHTTRQDLSQSLYQQDAATRVIVRLQKEKAAAVALAENYQAKLASQPALAAPPQEPASANGGKRAAEEDAGPEDPKRAKGGLPEDVDATIVASSTELSAQRKKRVISPTLASPSEIGAFASRGTHPLHKVSQGGIRSIDLSPDGANFVATAGQDYSIRIFDQSEGKVVANLTGHTKKVNDVKYLASSQFLVSASADKTVRLWDATRPKNPFVFKDHSADVVAITLQATKKYFVSASADKTWCLYDVDAQTCITQVSDAAVEKAYSAASFHPDGVILGTGTEENIVRIWELRTRKNVATFGGDAGHTGAVSGLSFSENGYYLATSSMDGAVKIWDLRKLKAIRTLTTEQEDPITSVAFDLSGLYLAAGGASVRIYGVKQEWSVLANLTEVAKKGVYSIKWGADAKSLYVGSSDHNLRIFGVPEVAGDGDE